MTQNLTLDFPISDQLIDFAESLRLRGKLPATVESYVRDAQRFVAFTQEVGLPLKDVEPATMVAFQDYLRHELCERENSIRRTVIGVRLFFRFLMFTLKKGESPFDVVPIPQRDERLPKTLVAEQIDLLLKVAADETPEIKAARDVAMVVLLSYEGMKANELIQLRWVDLLDDGSNMTLAIPGTRARVIRLAASCRESLLRYREFHAQLSSRGITQTPHQHIFIAFKGREGGSLLPSMTRHGLKFVLYELGEKIRLPTLNTELLRHYAVSHLIGLGRSPEEVMHHLGLRQLGNIAKHLHLTKSDETTLDHPQHRSSGDIETHSP
jgi:integrase/recombinase XerD